MLRLLDILLGRIVSRGTLTLIDADGVSHRYGDGSPPGVAVRLRDKRLERQLVRDPQLAVGEAYMQGRLEMVQGSIYDFLELVLSNLIDKPLPTWTKGFDVARYALRRLMQFNPASRSQRNVAHHYDIDGAIYDLFLDSDRQYSCAYFTEGADLEEAQLAKKRHLAAKLAIDPGHRVLDIGSGWGGLGLYLAKVAQCDVTGVTLSQEQLKVSRERAAREGLSRAVHFKFQDYRQVEGRFDRIVSVGMFEHVGVNHYGVYFRKLRELLNDDGVALIHSIGRSEPPASTNPFIAKYIFPGGYIPALSEMTAAIERAGLIIDDVEVLRLHYAETLRAWRRRFLANWDKAAAIRDETFCRMWEFYLAASETAFRYQNLVVFQVQLSKRIKALPITRDYMFKRERGLIEHEGAERPRMAGE
ncbi:MAG TPA: cyclopropane-fatty-acyl-phospholipid synthase family protein [Hyphomicrobiaceae bacterium]|nr:cyclopropane-fatty-acyl-phospholipid synthase family protein [Hyphomicrobiaceae bacterium]